MKKRNRTQNIFWMLSAVFAFGFFLALGLPSIALGAPTPPEKCFPHADSGIGAVIPNVYDCSGNSPQGFPIYDQIGSCVTECINTGGGVVLNYGAYKTEPYCYGATKPASCTVAFSDKRIEINLQSGETKVLPPKPCNDTFCAIVNGFKNLPILLFLGLPVAFIAVVMWAAGAIASLTSGLLGGLLKTIILSTLSIKVIPGATGIHAIEEGWRFTRDLVNLLFLLVAVFIGLATILRIENYQFKKTLPKLLIGALLVNFSGVLVGVVVDFSNLLTKFFIDRIGTWGGIGTNLLDSSKALLTMLWGLIGNLGLDFSDYIKKLAEPIGSLAVMAIFYTILLLALFVIMIVFIARVSVLWVLTIMAPFAFASYALPGMKKFWDDWLKTLISWSIIGIPLSFFLYISSSLVTNLLDVSALLPVSTGDGEGLAGVLKGILGPTTVAVILIYGLNFSLKMAPASAQGLIKLGMGVPGLIAGSRIGQLAKAGIARRTQQALVGTSEGIRSMTGAGGGRGLLGRALSPLGWAARGANVAFGGRLIEAAAASQKMKLPKDFESWTGQDQEAWANSKILGTRDRLQLASVMADKGTIGGTTSEFRERAVAAAVAAARDEDIQYKKEVKTVFEALPHELTWETYQHMRLTGKSGNSRQQTANDLERDFERTRNNLLTLVEDDFVLEAARRLNLITQDELRTSRNNPAMRDQLLQRTRDTITNRRNDDNDQEFRRIEHDIAARTIYAREFKPGDIQKIDDLGTFSTRAGVVLGNPANIQKIQDTFGHTTLVDVLDGPGGLRHATENPEGLRGLYQANPRMARGLNTIPALRALGIGQNQMRDFFNQPTNNFATFERGSQIQEALAQINAIPGGANFAQVAEEYHVLRTEVGQLNTDITYYEAQLALLPPDDPARIPIQARIDAIRPQLEVRQQILTNATTTFRMHYNTLRENPQARPIIDRVTALDRRVFQID